MDDSDDATAHNYIAPLFRRRQRYTCSPPPSFAETWLCRSYFSRSIYTYNPLIANRYFSWSNIHSGNIAGRPVSTAKAALGACGAGRHAASFLPSTAVKNLQEELRAVSEKANQRGAEQNHLFVEDQWQDYHQGQNDDENESPMASAHESHGQAHHRDFLVYAEDNISHSYDGKASEHEAGISSRVLERRQLLQSGSHLWSKHKLDSSSHKVMPRTQSVLLSELYLGHKFASGAYSTIYLGKYKGSDVAVKILKRPDDGDEEKARMIEELFRNEASTLSQIRHQNIIKFIGACETSPIYCIVTEFLAVGSLRNFLNSRHPDSLSLKLIVDMALDVAQGMEYLHSQGVLHCDLKSENLLLQGNLGVKIADFGAACRESECTSSVMPADKNHVGTYRWMAPEMIRHKRLSRKVDVYSFGIVLWELLTGHVPFEDLSPVQAAYAVVNKHARPHIPPHCPDKLGLLLSQCWSHEPHRRPEFSYVVQVLKQIRESSLNMEQRMRRLERPWNPLLNCFGCIETRTSGILPSHY